MTFTVQASLLWTTPCSPPRDPSSHSFPTPVLSNFLLLWQMILAVLCSLSIPSLLSPSTTYAAVPQTTCSGSPPAHPFLHSCSCIAVWWFPQRHSTISVRSGLWRPPGPTLWSKQGRPQSCSKLLRSFSSWVLSISKDGESTTPLGYLLQYLTTLMMKNVFLISKKNFPCCSLWPLLLALLLCSLEKHLVPFSLWHPERWGR